MKNLLLTSLALIALLMMTSVSYADVIHEDNAYWYLDGSNVLTIFNPDTTWINGHNGSLLVKVQQTVYDQADTITMLEDNGDGNSYSGYLYVYSVTNLGVGTLDKTDKGITEFSVGWNVAPVYVTTDKQQTLPSWTVDTSSTQPTWKWTDTVNPGIKKNRTVCGFWAVSNIGADGEVKASAVHVINTQPQSIVGDTRTTGPVPDAPTFMSLLAGLAGFGVTRIRRKK